MPKEATVLKVFVASPSDVAAEREALAHAVDSINSIFAETTIRLELIRWEHDASPDLGEVDAQAVVNRQAEDCDIFVGIVWKTIGQPTQRAESGTIEEFERAIERLEKDPGSVRVMMYFKDSPPSSLEEIDLDQLQKVRKFQSRVKGLGLYYTFRSVNDFSNAVRQHLAKIVTAQLVQERTEGGPVVVVDLQETLSLDEEEGLLDLQEIVEEEMAALKVVSEEMGEATKRMGEQMREKASRLEIVNQKMRQARNPTSMRGEARRLLDRTASDMDQFVSALHQQLPRYKQHLDRGINAFVKSVPLHLQFEADRGQMLEAAEVMIESMSSLIATMEGFRDSVHRLPPLASSIIRSKRSTASALQQVIEITSNGRASVHSVLTLLGHEQS